MITACTQSTGQAFKPDGYNLNAPDSVYILPPILHEISGIVWLNESTLACVQDEKGVVYFFDLQGQGIVRELAFYEDGDFESITQDGDTLYVLRSDGLVVKISDYPAHLPQISAYETGIPAKNNEGLFFDSTTGQLLIGCKSNHGKGAAYKDKRAVYAFDTRTEKLSDAPYITFNLNDLRALATQQNITLPDKINKDGKKEPSEVKMKISALAKHPKTGDLFVLSASEHLLFVFDNTYKPKGIKALDPKLYNKAEGICFSPDGDLFISNEGGDGRATLLRLKFLAE